MKIVETDNYGGDYPDERFLNIPSVPDRTKADRIAKAINDVCSNGRYWKVVDDDYKLQPGFEP